VDKIPLVESQINEGKRLAEELVKEGFPVTAALWLTTDEDGQWYFYIVSPLVETSGAKAYRRFNEILRQMSPPSDLSMFDYKIIGPDRSVAQAARAIKKLHAGKGGFYFGGGGVQLPGRSIEGVYLYPSSPTVSAGRTSE
jgi:hypothetical protein